MVIYIHIPFCVKKCDYCDFLSAPADAATRERYIKCLTEELFRYGSKYGKIGRALPVTSVFFGGGTPSLLEACHIRDILECINLYYNMAENVEITMECNPGTLTEEKLKGYKKAGVNRLSIGLQSANDRELRSIGRIHTFEQFVYGYNMARECGFDNINVDLMSALPGQTLSSYEDTLKKVLALKPEHISAYSLILEEGTPLFEKMEELEKAHMPTGLPDEDTEREMYYMTGRLLAEAGYVRYEISNYAKKGCECRHNTAYWLRDDYLGVGIGAASCIDNVRMKNITDINRYMDIYSEGINEKATAFALDEVETDVLSRADMMAEYMFLGLRMMQGVSRKAFSRQFGIDYNDIYGEITDRLVAQGLIEIASDKDRLWLTPLGIDVSNMVLAQFVV